MNEQIINPNAEEIASLEAQIGSIDITKLDPNDNGKILSQEKPVETKVEVTTETEVTTVDPIITELERVRGQTQGKTPQEKFEYKLKSELARAKAMGIDIEALAGIKTEPTDVDEDKPLTRKDLETFMQRSSTKSATEMAMEITNEAERELHLHYLENKVNPNLTEEEKFQTARDMVNAIKLKNQITLGSIKPQAQTHSTASSFQPTKTENFDGVKLTPEEDMLLRDSQIRGIPFTKEEILASRTK